MDTRRNSSVKARSALVWIAAALLCLALLSCGRAGNGLYGRWKIVPSRSASIDPWADLVLDIRSEGTSVTVVKRYSAGNRHDQRVDSMTVSTDGQEQSVPVPPGRWLGEVSMAIYYGSETGRRVRARLSGSGNELHIDTHETLETAQGETGVNVSETYALAPDGSTLELDGSRSTRISGPPLHYTFARAPQ